MRTSDVHLCANLTIEMVTVEDEEKDAQPGGSYKARGVSNWNAAACSTLFTLICL